MRSAELEQAWTARMVRVAQAAEMPDQGAGCKALPGGVVTSIRIMCDGESRGDVLLVVKARMGGQAYVGFVGGLDVMTALLTWRKKELGAGLKFREEKPWGGRTGGE
ncbi:MAG: hypothetical protein KAV00_18465 [Phycisphaerae bacterium]|nr:hypothetical protein [Phycisphaerae bacterium]